MGRKKRSTFKKKSSGSRVNIAAIARRNWNQNLHHYRGLHARERKRDPVELEVMRLAARRRPGGWASRFLASTGHG